MSGTQPNIALFVTCPVDIMRPEIGFASVKLLEQAGCRVKVPPQSCCGQIAFNNGFPDDARALAWKNVEIFEPFDYVVTPSGSCGGMLRHHYPALFENDTRLGRVTRFCEKVFELTTFLHDILKWRPKSKNCDLGTRCVTYHDSCAGLRELGIRVQPRSLMQQCANVQVVEMSDTEICCGFGGSFCMKYPDIACRMADNKLANAGKVTPDLLVGGDLSCLLHLAGRWQRLATQEKTANQLEIRHVAEVLAGMLDSPALNAHEPNASAD